jgi:hypothetical protein
MRFSKMGWRAGTGCPHGDLPNAKARQNAATKEFPMPGIAAISSAISTLSAEQRREAYFLAVSALQKASRLRDWAAGRRPASLLWHLSKSKLFHRIHTILFEESGRDYEVLEWFAANATTASWKSFEAAMEICRKVIEARNTRENNEFSTALAFAHRKKSPRFQNFSELRSILEKNLWQDVAKDYNAVKNREQSFSVVMEKYEAIGMGVPSWLRELLVRSNDKYDWGVEGFFVPYSFHLDCGKTYPVEHEWLPAGKDHEASYKGLFLLSSIDRHTLPGKAILSEMKAEGAFDFLKERDLAEASWLFHSMPNKGVQSTSYGYLWQDRATSAFFPRNDIIRMVITMQDLNRLRIEMLEKNYGWFLNLCENVAQALQANKGTLL